MRVTPQSPVNAAPASHRNDARRRSLRSRRSSPSRMGGSTPSSRPSKERSLRGPRRGKAAANVVKASRETRFLSRSRSGAGPGLLTRARRRRKPRAPRPPVCHLRPWPKRGKARAPLRFRRSSERDKFFKKMFDSKPILPISPSHRLRRRVSRQKRYLAIRCERSNLPPAERRGREVLVV